MCKPPKPREDFPTTLTIAESKIQIASKMQIYSGLRILQNIKKCSEFKSKQFENEEEQAKFGTSISSNQVQYLAGA